MTEGVEGLVLRNLIYNEGFARKVIPYIKDEYFHNKTEKELFSSIAEFILKYNNCPTIEALEIGFSNKKISSDVQKEIDEFLVWAQENKDTVPDDKWLLDQTEKFCKDKSIYNAVLESISILEDKKGTLDKGAIPGLLSDALGVGFNTDLGHDYFDDAEARWEYYHKVENKIPFDLEYFNKITKGGIPKKTLNCIIAGVNVGKSLIMCHLAASYITQGKNVLYITLEMGEEEIAKRIDANLYNMDLDDIVDLPKIHYMKRMEKLKEKITGKLKIEEFPTGGASALHFKTLLRELALKSNFVPDVVFIDYINICASSRIKHNGNTNTWVKSISEELRGLAVEMNVLMWTATQLTRGGFCLDIDTLVYEEQKGQIKIKDISVGDMILSKNGYNMVKNIFDIQKKKSYRIITESGKEIICSAEHLFPIKNGEKSISDGLSIGEELIVIPNSL